LGRARIIALSRVSAAARDALALRQAACLPPRQHQDAPRTQPQLDGKEETSTARVLYDMLKLYGKISASRPVTVYRE